MFPLRARVTGWLLLTLAVGGPLCAQSYRDEGTLAYRRGDYEDAVTLFEKSVATALKTLKEDDIDLVERRAELAEAYRAAGRLDDAVKNLDYVWKRARYDAEQRQHWDKEEGDVAMSSLEKLARIYLAQSRFEDAMLMLSTGLFDAERTKRDEDTLQFSALLAETQFVEGKEVDAATTAAKAFAAVGRLDAKPSLQVRALGQLGAMCLRHQQIGLARPMAQRALEIAQKQEPDGSITVAECQTRLAEVMLQTDAFDEAAKLLQDANEMILKLETPQSPHLVEVLLAMTDLALKKEAPDDALKHAQAALDICRLKLTKDDPRLGRALKAVADSRLARNEPKLAKPLYEQALPLLEKTLGESDAITEETRTEIANLSEKTVSPAKSSSRRGKGK